MAKKKYEPITRENAKPEKVFCRDCIWLMDQGYGQHHVLPHMEPDCTCVENTGNWLAPDRLRDKPSSINANNECKWFKHKKEPLDLLT